MKSKEEEEKLTEQMKEQRKTNDRLLNPLGTHKPWDEEKNEGCRQKEAGFRTSMRRVRDNMSKRRIPEEAEQCVQI